MIASAVVVGVAGSVDVAAVANGVLVERAGDGVDSNRP